MENKKYEKALIQEAKLQNQLYSYTHIQPCAYFWKQLVTGNQTPFLMVPDTLIMNDKQTPLIWIYTNSKGMLQKSTNINLKDFINKITNYGSPNQLSAILKRVTYNDNFINGNQVKLLNSRYLQNASLQQLGGQGQMLITLQRYIKSNGNNAFICRSILRKNRNSECFIITNKKSFFDQNEPQNKRFLVKIGQSRNELSHSTIIKAIQGNHLKQTCKYLSSITNFMKLYRGIIISELVGDFIKDQGGNWWLINIKAFRLQQKLIKNPRSTGFKQRKCLNQNQNKETDQKQKVGEKYQKQKYQKTKICRYCQKSYLQSQLTHYMTIRMLIQTDRYLLHLGKNYKWLKRSDIQNVDSYCLYQQHKICQRCYRLYMEIQSLMEIQHKFLKKLGFQMDKKPKQLLMDLTNEEQLKNQSKNKELINLANFYQQPANQANMFSNSLQKVSWYSQKYHTNQQFGWQYQSKKQNQKDCFSRNSNYVYKAKVGGQYSKEKITNEFPPMIELGPNSNIIFQQNVPVKNDQNINKMRRYRMILYLKEIDQIQLPPYMEDNSLNNIYLQYQLFGVKNRLKLDLNHNFNKDSKVLSIKKLKINYFFSHSNQEVATYLNSQTEDLTIKIIYQPKHSKSGFNDSYQSQKEESQKKNVIGKLTLPIKQYFNLMIKSSTTKTTKKDFYKFFSVKQVAYGWGLQGSIGIVPSQNNVNTSRMIFFTNDGYIYLPNQNYYYCEYLPEEWIDVIKKNCAQKQTNPSDEYLIQEKGTFKKETIDQLKNQQVKVRIKTNNSKNQKSRKIFNQIKAVQNYSPINLKTINLASSQKASKRQAQQKQKNMSKFKLSTVLVDNVNLQKHQYDSKSINLDKNTGEMESDKKKIALQKEILKYQKVNKIFNAQK